jgi:hypothetical protein
VTSAACGQRVPGTTESSSAAASPFGPTTASSSGGTLVEKLTGVAIRGVVPEGQALADESRFASGGDTILTVQVKKVNLPNGTVLNVTLDFMQIGSLVLNSGSGTMKANLGHFGVSRDQVAVRNGSVIVLSGGHFE